MTCEGPLVPSWAEKIAGLRTAEDCVGFAWGLTVSGVVLSAEDRDALARRKAELMRREAGA